ncbi:MAG TPA: helix-turn-helix domain-containing protein [Pseudonocardiaceae bacterium]|nr:helix-turn-helix domain-containing protein [Pseudonocardiaceae bacterium]
MPRLTEANRAAKRAEILAAARRCFARDGFHQTAMPDIAREAGVSVGAPYRYFASKEELILELAGEAFTAIFDPIVATAEPAGVADLVADAISTTPAGELLRCAVQAWSELLINDAVGERALAGFENVRLRLADVLRRGQNAGTVPLTIDPERGARVIMALLHGFLLQRVAFGLDDVAGFVAAVRAMLK